MSSREGYMKYGVLSTADAGSLMGWSHLAGVMIRKILCIVHVFRQVGRTKKCLHRFILYNFFCKQNKSGLLKWRIVSCRVYYNNNTCLETKISLPLKRCYVESHSEITRYISCKNAGAVGKKILNVHILSFCQMSLHCLGCLTIIIFHYQR